jgi:hypothetical protein
MGAAVDKLVARLSGASASDTDDDRNGAGSGNKKEWSVRIESVNVNIELGQDFGGLRVEKFTVTGKWTSHVRSDTYQFGVLYDKEWGDDKNPYGNIAITAKAVDGGITSDVKVEVDNYDDSANRYAREKAEGLICSIVVTTVAG